MSINNNNNNSKTSYIHNFIFIIFFLKKNSVIHYKQNFIEDFECDRFDERSYNEKRNQVDVIANTTSRLNGQLAVR